MLHVATLGSIGFLPASGTMATFVTLPIVAFFSFFSLPVRIVIVSGAALLAYFIIDRACQQIPFVKDPPCIVLDEVIGFCVACLGAPTRMQPLLLGFVLFRFFDIVKPCGIARVQRLPGALGILADDIVAGLYTLGILWLLQ